MTIDSQPQIDLSQTFDVLVVGGGNAALCAAMTARENGASVLVLESPPIEFHGGNIDQLFDLFGFVVGVFVGYPLNRFPEKLTLGLYCAHGVTPAIA